MITRWFAILSGRYSGQAIEYAAHVVRDPAPRNRARPYTATIVTRDRCEPIDRQTTTRSARLRSLAECERWLSKDLQVEELRASAWA